MLQRSFHCARKSFRYEHSFVLHFQFNRIALNLPRSLFPLTAISMEPSVKWDSALQPYYYRSYEGAFSLNHNALTEPLVARPDVEVAGKEVWWAAALLVLLVVLAIILLRYVLYLRTLEVSQLTLLLLCKELQQVFSDAFLQLRPSVKHDRF